MDVDVCLRVNVLLSLRLSVLVYICMSVYLVIRVRASVCVDVSICLVVRVTRTVCGVEDVWVFVHGLKQSSIQGPQLQ